MHLTSYKLVPNILNIEDPKYVTPTFLQRVSVNWPYTALYMSLVITWSQYLFTWRCGTQKV